jgi:hypothetical protein
MDSPGTACEVNGNDGTGVIGDQTKAILDLGKMFIDAKINFAVAQIKQLVADGK